MKLVIRSSYVDTLEARLKERDHHRRWRFDLEPLERGVSHERHRSQIHPDGRCSLGGCGPAGRASRERDVQSDRLQRERCDQDLPAAGPRLLAHQAGAALRVRAAVQLALVAGLRPGSPTAVAGTGLTATPDARVLSKDSGIKHVAERHAVPGSSTRPARLLTNPLRPVNWANSEGGSRAGQRLGRCA